MHVDIIFIINCMPQRQCELKVAAMNASTQVWEGKNCLDYNSLIMNNYFLIDVLVDSYQ